MSSFVTLRDPNGRWYSDDSPWNASIPANARVAPGNDKYSIGFKYAAGVSTAKETAAARADGSSFNPLASAPIPHIFNLAYGGIPSVGIASTDTPLVRVRINYSPGGELRLQIPVGLVLPPGPETTVAILLPDGREIDCYKLSAPGQPLEFSDKIVYQTPDSDAWTAVIAAVSQSGWVGPGYGMSSTRESNTLNGSGMIRPRDFMTPAGGHWDHAIALVGGPLTTSNVPPFSHGVGDNNKGTMKPAYCVPYGAHIQLDPTLNIDLLNNDGTFVVSGSGNAPEWKKQYCRTLQVKGAFPVDSNSSGVGTGWTSVMQYPYTQFINMLGFGNGSDDNIPASLAGSLRVLDWTAA